MTATVSAERATTIQRHAASFNEGTAPSTQSFLENAGPYGSSFAGTSVGSAPHATHPVLVEAEGSIRGLASRMPPHNGDSGLCISPGLLEEPLLAKVRHDPRHGAQKEGCHNRCFQQGLGSVVRGQTDLRPVVWRGVGPAQQLHRNASSVWGLSILPAGHSGTPCANTLRQQGRGAIHKSPGRPHLEVTLHAGEWPSCVGSEQSALTEGDACAGQNEPRSRHVVEEQFLFRGMDAPPARRSENLGSLWQSSSRPLRLRRQLSLPNLFYKEHGYPGPRMAQPFALCFSPFTLLLQVLRRVREQRHKLILIAPPGGTNRGCRSYSSRGKQLSVRSPWDGTSSLKQTARYGIHGPSYGPCMCGRSTGAFFPPRACPKHYGRS